MWEPQACAADCGRDVRYDQIAVQHTDGRRWHAECWWADHAPGQGDLLDILAVRGG